MTSPSMPPADMLLNDGCEYREQLGPAADGRTRLGYLSGRYRHSSATEWAARIRAGHVLVDARPANADSVLRKGAELVWRRPPWLEPAAPTSFTVLYEAAEQLAVATPAALPTLTGAFFLLVLLL